jgi:hypothetical protein
MSIAAVSWALRQKVGDATAKLVLIALADFADENDQCWPSQKLLAERAECSIDTVQRKIKIIENLVSVIPSISSNGGRASNVYQLHVSSGESGKSPTSGTPPRTLRHTPGNGQTLAANCGTPYRSHLRYPLPQQGAVTGTVIEPPIEPPAPGPPKAIESETDKLNREAFEAGEKLKQGLKAKSARAVGRSRGELDGSQGIEFSDGKLRVTNGSAAALAEDFPGINLAAVCDRAAPELAKFTYPSKSDAMAVLRKWARIASDNKTTKPRTLSRYGAGA